MFRASKCARPGWNLRTQAACPRGRRLASIVVLGLASLTHLRSTAQQGESIPKADSPVHGNPKNGKHLYDSYGCYECHGGQAQGSPLSGPSIGPEPMKFTAFVRYIRRPSGQMPPYSDKITSQAELADIYAFLVSLPHPPDAKTIPLLTPPSAPEKKR
jgi:mono/diheme cytochrome c family protein